MSWERRSVKWELWSDFLGNIQIMSWAKTARGNQRLKTQEYCCGSHLWSYQHANEQSTPTSNSFDTDTKFFKFKTENWGELIGQDLLCIGRCAVESALYLLTNSCALPELMCCVSLSFLVSFFHSVAGCVCAHMFACAHLPKSSRCEQHGEYEMWT